MPSQKRDRGAELVPESVAPHIPMKRARTESSHAADEDFKFTVRTRNGYSRPLLTVWSLSMTRHQKIYLTRIVKELIKLKPASDLIRPPNKNDWPRWAKNSKEPMDLSTMRSLLIIGKYSSVTGLVTDFWNMICTVLQINGWDHDKSARALTILQCFRQRMRYCPVGPGRRSMWSHDDAEIRRMASQVEDDMIHVSEPTPEKLDVISISDSDAREHAESTEDSEAGDYDCPFIDSDMSHEKSDGHSPTTHDTKTPEPDDLQKATQQLQREIDERQQKLANLAEKKRILAEIKDLDTGKAAIDNQLPETKRQAEQLQFKIQDCCQRITTLTNEYNGPYQASLWRRSEIMRLQRQRERLQLESESCRQASEVHRQEDERLSAVVNDYLQRITALDLEQKQVQEYSRQAIETEAQLKDERDRIENQRAIAKKKLDQLNSSSA